MDAPNASYATNPNLGATNFSTGALSTVLQHVYTGTNLQQYADGVYDVDSRVYKIPTGAGDIGYLVRLLTGQSLQANQGDDQWSLMAAPVYATDKDVVVIRQTNFKLTVLGNTPILAAANVIRHEEITHEAALGRGAISWKISVDVADGPEGNQKMAEYMTEMQNVVKRTIDLRVLETGLSAKQVARDMYGANGFTGSSLRTTMMNEVANFFAALKDPFGVSSALSDAITTLNANGFSPDMLLIPSSMAMHIVDGTGSGAPLERVMWMKLNPDGERTRISGPRPVANMLGVNIFRTPIAGQTLRAATSNDPGLNPLRREFVHGNCVWSYDRYKDISSSRPFPFQSCGYNIGVWDQVAEAFVTVTMRTMLAACARFKADGTLSSEHDTLAAQMNAAKQDGKTPYGDMFISYDPDADEFRPAKVIGDMSEDSFTLTNLQSIAGVVADFLASNSSSEFSAAEEFQNLQYLDRILSEAPYNAAFTVNTARLNVPRVTGGGGVQLDVLTVRDGKTILTIPTQPHGGLILDTNTPLVGGVPPGQASAYGLASIANWSKQDVDDLKKRAQRALAFLRSIAANVERLAPDCALLNPAYSSVAHRDRQREQSVYEVLVGHRTFTGYLNIAAVNQTAAAAPGTTAAIASGATVTLLQRLQDDAAKAGNTIDLAVDEKMLGALVTQINAAGQDAGDVLVNIASNATALIASLANTTTGAQDKFTASNINRATINKIMSSKELFSPIDVARDILAQRLARAIVVQIGITSASAAAANGETDVKTVVKSVKDTVASDEWAVFNKSIESKVIDLFSSVPEPTPSVKSPLYVHSVWAVSPGAWKTYIGADGVIQVGDPVAAAEGVHFKIEDLAVPQIDRHDLYANTASLHLADARALGGAAAAAGARAGPVRGGATAASLFSIGGAQPSGFGAGIAQADSSVAVPRSAGSSYGALAQGARGSVQATTQTVPLGQINTRTGAASEWRYSTPESHVTAAKRAVYGASIRRRWSEAGRMTDQWLALALRVYLCVPLNYDSLLNLDALNVPQPFSVFGARPFVRTLTESAILLRSQGATMLTLYKTKILMGQETANTAEFGAHMFVSYGVMAHAPRGIQVLDHLSSAGYVRGNEVVPIATPQQMDAVLNEDAPGDIFWLLVPLTAKVGESAPNPQSLTGFLKRQELDLRFAPSYHGLPTYPTFAYYDLVFGFSKIPSPDPTGLVDGSERGSNIIMLRDAQRSYSYAQKGMVGTSDGTTHFGPNAYGPGSSDVRNGSRRIFSEFNVRHSNDIY